jgi:hypothetical protein
MNKADIPVSLSLALGVAASAQSRIWDVPGTQGILYSKPKWVSSDGTGGSWIYAIEHQNGTVRIDPFSGASWPGSTSGVSTTWVRWKAMAICTNCW